MRLASRWQAGFATRGRRFSRPALLLFALSALLSILPSSPSYPQGDAAKVEAPKAEAPKADAPKGSPQAYMLRVTLPIKASSAAHVRTQVEQFLGEARADGGQRPVLIFEFRARPGQSTAGSEFGVSYDLADFLSGEKLNRVRTVAWLPGGDDEESRILKGHALLPVLACEEIIMAPTAELGDAGNGLEQIPENFRASYAAIANRHRTLPAALAVGLLDKSQEVMQADTLDGKRIVLGSEMEELRKKAAVKSEVTLKAAGEPARFTGQKLRVDYSLINSLAGSEMELADRLGVPLGSIDKNPALGGQWKAVRMEISGPMTHQKVHHVQTSLKQRLDRHDVNLLLLTIDSQGGALEESKWLADFLADLDPHQVRTVAYVPNAARADAALVALACDQLVVHEHTTLGGPGANELGPQEQSDVQQAARNLAERKARSWSLMAGAVDHRLEVHRYVRGDSGEVAYFCAEELASLKEKTPWEQGQPIDNGEGISGDKAQEYGLAQYIVQNGDELKTLFHLGDDVEEVKLNWAHTLVAALASPTLSGFLLFFGFLMLVWEMWHPGTAVAGFLAAVCFLLFFWSHYLQGTAGWLEVILFVAGLGFVALEIFVIPGFGIFGLGGGAMILASILLASQTFIIPRNSYQLVEFSVSLRTLAMAIVAVGCGFIFLRKYIRRTPGVSAVMLEPPGGSRIADLNRRESLVDFAHLLGKRGMTVTPLVPSGKARFGDQLVDVMSEGDLISKGADVYITQVQGNRIVVRPVDDRSRPA